MNRNIPHAISIVREKLASGGSDPAVDVVQALEDAGVLVDPERSYDAVQFQGQPELTELETQARAWDATCKRARELAAAIERALGGHHGFQRAQADRDSVLVALHITDQSQWGEWRRWFGITHDCEVSQPYMVAGEGYRDGIRVSVLAYHLPQARALAREIARQPYEFEGIVYDLARPQRDGEGETWFYKGIRTSDGMPLLSMAARPERCSLANLVQQVGPLAAVTDDPSTQVTPVTTGAEGGETA
ncbi:BN159_2729 family protein [Streptomyces sp. NPDC047000]|uniref:BN159_2729 family protein n=1 Tax=Streptomyces sp. NPDC047000 TaxID=3155474 RepID=UPI00340D287B